MLTGFPPTILEVISFVVLWHLSAENEQAVDILKDSFVKEVQIVYRLF